MAIYGLTLEASNPHARNTHYCPASTTADDPEGQGVRTMKSTKVLAGLLVSLATIGSISLAVPAEARSNANWDLNRMAVQMYQQNMATQAQMNAQAAIQAQAAANYQQQLAAQQQAAALQAQCNNPYASYNYNPYAANNYNQYAANNYNPYAANNNWNNRWNERQHRFAQRIAQHRGFFGF
jgi:hypothetical protein